MLTRWWGAGIVGGGRQWENTERRGQWRRRALNDMAGHLNSIPGAWVQRNSEGRQAGRGRMWGPDYSTLTFGEWVSNHRANSLVAPPDSSKWGQIDVTSSWLSGKERKGTWSRRQGTCTFLPAVAGWSKNGTHRALVRMKSGKRDRKCWKLFTNISWSVCRRPGGGQVILVDRRRIGLFCLPRTCPGICSSAGPRGPNWIEESFS